MNAYALSPHAVADLDDIWDYTSERWGEAQAERYVRALAHVFQRLADGPQLGRACDELRKGYRRFGCGSHIVFYRL